MAILQDLGLLVAGLLMGFGMTPLFAAPSSAPLAIGGGVLLLVLCFGMPSATRSMGNTKGVAVVLLAGACLGLLSWRGASSAMADSVPPIEYSMRALTADQAAPFRRPGETAWYRLQVVNRSGQDVADLHTAVHLPDVMSASPRLIDSGRVVDLVYKSSFAVNVVKRGPDSSAEPLAGFTSVAVIEASRLLSGGKIDLLLPTRTALPNDKDAKPPYGAIITRRRHQHYNTSVDDVDRLPITGVDFDRELMGTDQLPEDARISSYSPLVRVEELLGGMKKGETGRIELEMAIE